MDDIINESPIRSEIIRAGWELGNGHTVRTKARSTGSIGGVAGFAVADVCPAPTEAERELVRRFITSAPELLSLVEEMAMGWSSFDDDSLASQEAHDHFRAVRRSYRADASCLISKIAG